MTFSFFACIYVLKLLLNKLPPSLSGRAAHFSLMTEEYLKGKGKRIAPIYQAAITQLS